MVLICYSNSLNTQSKVQKLTKNLSFAEIFFANANVLNFRKKLKEIGYDDQKRHYNYQKGCDYAPS